jgi:hypothetical protein
VVGTLGLLRINLAAARASSGWPLAGYCISCSWRGKPPKSWIVDGVSFTVTPVAPLVSQWADTTRIARGAGRRLPQAASSRVNRLSEIAFIGLPWPMNSTGWRGGLPVAWAAGTVVLSESSAADTALRDVDSRKRRRENMG